MASSPRASLGAVLAVSALAVSALALPGCSAGEEVPDADAVIEMTTYLQGLSEDNDLLVPPTVGVGTRALPTFSTAEGYRWRIRCLSDEMPGVSITDPQAEAADEAFLQLEFEQNPLDRPCQRGESSGGNGSTGGQVEVTITAEPETYWVAAVYESTGSTESNASEPG
ncbi:hypothetical protein WDZ16_16570 [Pseudokineococcus marinus]|uniref:Secreted protein n=1 Tax=Pseudokineococcus marinus TaxID=351215 RepID=A0A849BIT8_9ACTN|nr:hypothetical protein [Pseudokineococcus marinus]NNH22521.1 hypothetical protein [Pseudokineococcus marinus]